MLPAYALHTPRLLLRCLGPEDVADRKAAVDASGEHLKDYFPPTPDGPVPLEVHVAQIRRARGHFDLDDNRAYGSFEREGNRFLGETGLLKRAGIAALEIFYWMRADAVGKGLATEMVQAMVKTAFEIDRVKRLDLMCGVENERSAAMAKRLGFTFEGRLRDRQLAPHHPRADLLCFTMLAAEYPTTPAAQLPLEAFDFLGQRIDYGALGG